jgi:hypothetical protein
MAVEQRMAESVQAEEFAPPSLLAVQLTFLGSSTFNWQLRFQALTELAAGWIFIALC